MASLALLESYYCLNGFIIGSLVEEVEHFFAEEFLPKEIFIQMVKHVELGHQFR